MNHFCTVGHQVLCLIGTMYCNQLETQVSKTVCIDLMVNRLVRTQNSPSLLDHSTPLCPLMKAWQCNVW